MLAKKIKVEKMPITTLGKQPFMKDYTMMNNL